MPGRVRHDGWQCGAGHRVTEQCVGGRSQSHRREHGHDQGNRSRPDRRGAARLAQAGGRRDRRPQAEAVHADDGAWLRPGAVRRVAQAADFSHLHLRLSQCRRGQAPFRGRDRKAAGWGGGPRLFALQRAQSGDTGGSAVGVGGCRGRARFLQRHVGDCYSVPVDGQAGRHDRPFRAALCRHRDADRAHPGPLRGALARLPGGRDSRGDRCGAVQGGVRQRCVDLSRKPRQPDQRVGRCGAACCRW
jgi:hypothetical protein